MMMSKFVEYFKEEVTEWQRKLVTADSVIQVWLEVQRTWSHLESIFIGSKVSIIVLASAIQAIGCSYSKYAVEVIELLQLSIALPQR